MASQAGRGGAARAAAWLFNRLHYLALGARGTYGFRRDGHRYRVGTASFREFYFWRSFAWGRWEPETFATLRAHASPAAMFVDVGAWVGPLSLWMAHRCRRVISIEPDPVAFARLAGNVELSALRNVELVNAAIAAVPGRIPLYAHGDFGSSMSSTAGAPGAKSVEVDARTLDDIGGDPADVVKMDVEGGEYRVVPGSTAYLGRIRGALLLSLHPLSLAAADRESRTLELIRALRESRLLLAPEPAGPQALEELAEARWLERNLSITLRPWHAS